MPDFKLRRGEFKHDTAAELTRIMGQKNLDKFFNAADTKDPGHLLYPPAPTPPSREVIKGQVQMRIAQDKSQHDQQTAAQTAQLEQANDQTDALHQQIKVQADIEMTKVKAELDAKLAVIDAHIKAALAEQGAFHAAQAHGADMAHSALDLVAAARAHDGRMEQMRGAKTGASILGARRPKDGKHCVSRDPDRPGKYLMVVPNG